MKIKAKLAYKAHKRWCIATRERKYPTVRALQWDIKNNANVHALDQGDILVTPKHGAYAWRDTTNWQAKKPGQSPDYTGRWFQVIQGTRPEYCPRIKKGKLRLVV